MQKTTNASIDQQQTGCTHRGGLIHSLLVSVFLIVLGLFSTSLWAQVSSDSVEISGEASVVVEDNFETGEATYRYFIVELPPRANGPSTANSRSKIYTEIFFKDKVDEHFKTGKKIKLRGKRSSKGKGIDVESIELLEPEPGTETDTGEASGFSEAPVATPESRKVLTLLVDFNDAVVFDTETPSNTPNGATLQNVKDIMFNNDKNVSHFYNTASLGTLTIPSDPNATGGEAVYGPYLIDFTLLDDDPKLCDVGAWQDAALTAWETATGFDRSDYRHHSFVIPNYWDYGANRNCGWGGFANVGCGESCWAFSADPVSILHGVVIHELGHNFTFGHARTDLDNDGVTDPGTGEYGDRSDMMGGSRNWMKFNPPHHEFVNWYDPDTYELRNISSSSTPQSFDLIPVDEEDSDWPGLRTIKTTRDNSSSYYLSYRQQTGHYNNVTSDYTSGASLHWRFNEGNYLAYASYFIQTIDAGDMFADVAANLVVWGVGPATIDNNDFTDQAQIFTVNVCNTSCSVLLKPLNLVAQGIASDAIQLTWQDLTGVEDGFAIEQSPDGSSWSALTTVAANTVSYVHSDLAAGNTFYYRVRSYQGQSETSDWSDIASAKTELVIFADGFE